VAIVAIVIIVMIARPPFTNNMNKNTGIIIGIIALVIVAGGVYASMNSKDEAMMAKDKMEMKAMEDAKMAEEKKMMDKKAMEDKEAMMKDAATNTESMMKKDGVSTTDKSDVMVKSGSYEAYSADKIAKAAQGKVIIFFHASWCPSCRGLNASIDSNLAAIPKDVTILKADYDKETELKKKYGVTSQHTLVQVDKDGNMIKKWSGGSSLDNLVSKIQ
jgi:thioredoxin 1